MQRLVISVPCDSTGRFSILTVLHRSLSNGAVAVRLTAPANAPARRYFRSVSGIITSPSILSPYSKISGPQTCFSGKAFASFAALHEKVLCDSLKIQGFDSLCSSENIYLDFFAL
ncbi:unnamed protein product [Rhizophagus irregularis]|uniref:Uncharacterized protein n=1 Tax=Rhizophagus irregularis TaxID=588596 RepID=A0A915Z517_9GLOM|nr:unnamed protein product [Rhizophagus irregularis]